jgi:hypothetical protein
MKKLITSWIFISTILLVQAQELKVSSNRDQVPSNSSIQITYTIENADKVKNFRPPNFSPFKSRGPSTSTSMQIINGNVSKSESYTYTLIPTKKGSFKIEPATAEINGKQKQSPPINIEVVDAIDQSAQGNTRNQQNQASDAIDEKQLAENLFVRVIPSKSSVYKGEQVNLTYKLYSRVSLRNIQMTKQPKYNNFLQKDIELGDDAKQQKIEVYNGKEFRTQTFNKVALFPTQAGKIEVPPIAFDAEILYRSQDPFFRSSFFTRTRAIPYSFKSNPIIIDVKSLPNSKPKGYIGGVGKFEYEVHYDKNETAANDPITLSIRISGQGNINLVNMEKPDFPSSFDVFDPKVKENVSTRANKVNGSKTYEYLIIPRGGGDFKMPDLVFSHFDPETGAYVSKNFEGPYISVSGETFDGEASPGVLGLEGKRSIDVLNEDIRYIQEGQISQNSYGAVFSQWWFWTLTIVPLISLAILPGLLSQYRNKMRAQQEMGAFASKNAIQKLRELEKSDADHEQKLGQVQQILWQFVAEKTRIPLAQLSKEKAVEQLKQAELNVQASEEWKDIIQKAEGMAYAPYGFKEIGDMIQRSVNCIQKMEA